jgi:hypothetical protein
VPWAELACSRVGDDGDGMAVQLSRPTLRPLSGPAARTGRQPVCLHGAGNRSPTRHGEDVRVSGSHYVSWPTPQSESRTARARRRLLVRGRDFSEGVPLVGNWSEVLPTGREQAVLPVRVLTGVLNPPCPESWPAFVLSILAFTLSMVSENLVLVRDYLAVKGDPNPGPRQQF